MIERWLVKIKDYFKVDIIKQKRKKGKKKLCSK